MNLNKLKGKLREHNSNYNETADFLGLSVTAFSNKMNGKSKFYVDEIEKLSERLNLSDAEKIDIFLT